jgi:hypothetical protein
MSRNDKGKKKEKASNLVFLKIACLVVKDFKKYIKKQK